MNFLGALLWYHEGMTSNEAIGMVTILIGIFYWAVILIASTFIGILFGYSYLKIRRNNRTGKRTMIKKILPFIMPELMWGIGFILFEKLNLSDLTSRDEFIILPFAISVPLITAVSYVVSYKKTI